jgi:hypothetical protein
VTDQVPHPHIRFNKILEIFATCKTVSFPRISSLPGRGRFP